MSEPRSELTFDVSREDDVITHAVDRFVDGRTRRIGSRPVRQLDEQALRRIFRFIEAELTRDLTVEELSAIAGVGKYHLSRRFKATMGLSLYAFITLRRVEHAQVLLTTTDLSLDEVGERVRVPNVNHLRNYLRRRFGVNPSDMKEGP